MSKLWNTNWVFSPIKTLKKIILSETCFQTHASFFSCKLDLTVFHWLFIPKCHATINISLVNHFYSMVNRFTFAREMGQMWDILTLNLKRLDGKCFFEAVPRILFCTILGCVYWTHLPHCRIWTVTRATDCTVGRCTHKKKLQQLGGTTPRHMDQ